MLFAQNNTFGDAEYDTDYYFGFRIAPSYSTVVQYCIVFAPTGKIEEVIPMSKSTFLAEIRGEEPSVANIKNSSNMLLLNNIDEKTLDDLWKLRYKEYPLFQMTPKEPGWSSSNENFIPAPKQTEILQAYGVDNINGIFFGVNALRLLKDMGDTKWIDSYKAANY